MSEYADRQIAARPEEAAHLRKLYTLLAENGSPALSINDGTGSAKTPTIEKFLEEAFSLDEFRIDCPYPDGELLAVWVVMGEAIEDMVYNYSTALDTALAPLWD